MTDRCDDFQIFEEKTLVEIPRGRDGGAVLRVRFVRARKPNGSEVAWHDVREHFRGDDGALHPTRKGISIRGKELHAVAVALLRACASSVPPDLHPAAKAIVAALSSKTEAAPRSSSRSSSRPSRPLTFHADSPDARPADLPPLEPDPEGVF